jgi:hypothetical protein
VAKLRACWVVVVVVVVTRPYCAVVCPNIVGDTTELPVLLPAVVATACTTRRCVGIPLPNPTTARHTDATVMIVVTALSAPSGQQDRIVDSKGLQTTY